MKRLLAAVLIALAGCASPQMSASPTMPANSRAGGPSAAHAPLMTYTALGDSITYGYFASRYCDPHQPSPMGLACGGTTDYPSLVAFGMSNALFQNLGVPGERITSFYWDELPAIASEAKLITVYIGENDFYDIAFYHSTETLLQYEQIYNQTLTYLQTNFPMARIVLLNIPNYGDLPCCQEFKNQGDPTWNAGNAYINSLAKYFPVVDLVCDRALYTEADTPAVNGMHPSDAGHAEIARQVLTTLKNPALPRRSCPPYFGG